MTQVERPLGIVAGDDLPGAEAPAAFTSWLRQGDTGHLIRVVEHDRLRGMHFWRTDGVANCVYALNAT